MNQYKKHTQIFLIYNLQNLIDVDNIWYILSWLKMFLSYHLQNEADSTKIWYIISD